MNKFIEEIEKEFDEKFPCRHHPTLCDGDCNDTIKAFFKEQITIAHNNSSAIQNEETTEIVKQVIHNPQVTSPAISYTITDESGDETYTSKYIDIADFEAYKERLEKQLIFRINSLKK